MPHIDTPPLRSLLFVPGDSERKLARAVTTAADALILDLEDSVAAAHLPAARVRVREFLRAPRHRSRQQLWVRVNGSSSGLLLDDLAAVLPGSPHGIVLPKVSKPQEITDVIRRIATLERPDIEPPATQLIVIATETPQALLSLGSYGGLASSDLGSSKRLVGLTWGSEDLAAALGINQTTDSAGALTPVFQLARSMCVIAAAAVGVQAIDRVFPEFRNDQGLQRELDSARRDGFTGKLAIHPDQIERINAAFTPTAAEIERAHRIVALFDAGDGSGVASLDGQMIDRPHLLQARRILALARR